ncbi:HIT family protein [Candidatus Parcubacteria bacterium]|nr:HIT family protein [Candidatus Parcubacteria bacterium]
MEQEKTIFEKIIDGEIPCTKVYEDEKLLAFLDINPVYYGHTLIIPKEKYVWMQDAPDNLISDIFIKTKELMKSIKKGLSCDYVQVSVVGDEVPHFHIHLIPRYHGRKNTGRINYKSSEQMNEYAEKIKSFL